MLKWRLLLGIPLVALLILLGWLDSQSAGDGWLPGKYLMFFFLLAVFFLCDEVMDLLNAGGIKPRRSTVFIGTYFTLISCWLACCFTDPIQEQAQTVGAAVHCSTIPITLPKPAWDIAAQASLLTLLAIAAGIIIAFVGEMLRFKLPSESSNNESGNPLSTEVSSYHGTRPLAGSHMMNLAGALFVICYIGVLGSFIIMLHMAYGVGAVLSLIIVAKFCDIGAYSVGRATGVHKLVPCLSPGKTIEGAIGGLVFAVLGAWLMRDIIFPYVFGREPQVSWGALILFGLVIGVAGAVGDLAESLIKRDVRRKDSGRFIPGFGGFLDIFDSLLLAAPVAFMFWTFGWIC